jgi:uncharacterized metal-binding protein YceD (DUF177 family)
MYKILIEDIEREGKPLHYEFNEEIPELKADIKAEFDLASLGEFIEVKGKIKGNVKLVCDLCLEEFDYKLDFPVKELYAKTSLYEEYGQDTEIKEGQFVTDLNGADEIDIYDLMYQSVILQLPNKKVCGINCKGDNFTKDDSEFIQDERMAVFKSIKIERK